MLQRIAAAHSSVCVELLLVLYNIQRQCRRQSNNATTGSGGPAEAATRSVKEGGLHAATRYTPPRRSAFRRIRRESFCILDTRVSYVTSDSVHSRLFAPPAARRRRRKDESNRVSSLSRSLVSYFVFSARFFSYYYSAVLLLSRYEILSDDFLSLVIPLFRCFRNFRLVLNERYYVQRRQRGDRRVTKLDGGIRTDRCARTIVLLCYFITTYSIYIIFIVEVISHAKRRRRFSFRL